MKYLLDPATAVVHSLGHFSSPPVHSSTSVTPGSNVVFPQMPVPEAHGMPLLLLVAWGLVAVVALVFIASLIFNRKLNC